MVGMKQQRNLVDQNIFQIHLDAILNQQQGRFFGFFELQEGNSMNFAYTKGKQNK